MERCVVGGGESCRLNIVPGYPQRLENLENEKVMEHEKLTKWLGII